MICKEETAMPFIDSKITVPVAVSPQFFGWVFGLGGKATILGLKSVVKKMKDMIENIYEKY